MPHSSEIPHPDGASTEKVGETKKERHERISHELFVSCRQLLYAYLPHSNVELQSAEMHRIIVSARNLSHVNQAERVGYISDILDRSVSGIPEQRRQTDELMQAHATASAELTKRLHHDYLPIERAKRGVTDTGAIILNAGKGVFNKK